MTTQAGQGSPHPSYTINANVVRALLSVVETAGAIAATVLAGLNNGQDTHHALVAGAVAFIAHAINHNAGGSPI